MASESPIKRDTPTGTISLDEPTRCITLPALPLYAKTQDLPSHFTGERYYNEREWKRRRLGSTTHQGGTMDSTFRDPRDLEFEDTQDRPGRVWALPMLPYPSQVNIASTTPDCEVDHEAALTDHIQTWRAMTDVSNAKDVRAPDPGSSENDHDAAPIGFSRGRAPERIEQTRFSPLPQPVSRANSVSSVRSMIDERLEWAHQDRMRSDSRDGSVPRSPFHEHSPFYAEFAGHAGPEPPSSDHKSYPITTADSSHDPGAQPFKCSRVEPSTGKLCMSVFSRPYDLARHESIIHRNQDMRYFCPHCHEEKSFARSDALTRHIRVVHPGMSTHHWSCAALATPEDAICRVHHGLSVCAYCGMEVQGSSSGRRILEHLDQAHRFRKCDMEMKFFRPDQFRQHLEESHGGSSSGEWINILSNRCFGNDFLDRSIANASDGASQVSFTQKLGTTGLKESTPRCAESLDREYRDHVQAGYTCECCPKKPEKFYTEDSLRCAVDSTLLQMFYDF